MFLQLPSTTQHSKDRSDCQPVLVGRGDRRGSLISTSTAQSCQPRVVRGLGPSLVGKAWGPTANS